MRHPARFHPIALLLLVVHSTGCYHYTTPDMCPGAYIRQKEPKQIRLTLTDSSKVVLQEPWITRDSVGGLVKAVHGRWAGSGRPPTREERWSIARAGVARIEVHRLNAGLIGGIVGFGALFSPLIIGVLTY